MSILDFDKNSILTLFRFPEHPMREQRITELICSNQRLPDTLRHPQIPLETFREPQIPSDTLRYPQIPSDTLRYPELPTVTYSYLQLPTVHRGVFWSVGAHIEGKPTFTRFGPNGV